MADVGHTLHELHFTYPGVAISPQVTVPEVLPVESKRQTPEMAHSVSFFFLMASSWHRCQLPFSCFPVLLGICGMGGEQHCMQGKREPQSVHCRARCAACSLCSHMSPLDHRGSKPGRWQGWQVTVLGTRGHLSCRGEDPSPAMKYNPNLPLGSCCSVSDTS